MCAIIPVTCTLAMALAEWRVMRLMKLALMVKTNEEKRMILK